MRNMKTVMTIVTTVAIAASVFANVSEIGEKTDGQVICINDKGKSSAYSDREIHQNIKKEKSNEALLCENKEDEKIITQEMIDRYTGLTLLVAEGINGLRAEQNLEPYDINYEFNDITDIRALELEELFSHVRPNGTRGRDMIPTLGNGTWRGEIIAVSKTNKELSLECIANLIVEGWRNSPKHYDAIMADHFDEMGVGVNYYYDDEKEAYFCYAVALFRNGNEMKEKEETL